MRFDSVTSNDQPRMQRTGARWPLVLGVPILLAASMAAYGLRGAALSARLPGSSRSSATTLHVLTGSGRAAIGSPLTVELRVTGVETLWAYQVYLSFDPNVVQVIDGDASKDGVQVIVGDFLSQRSSDIGIVLNQADNTTGTIALAVTLINNRLRPVPPASGEGLMARIRLRGVAAGVSDIQFTSDTELYDARAEKIADLSWADGAIRVSAENLLLPRLDHPGP